jgi:hypothetical protein
LVNEGVHFYLRGACYGPQSYFLLILSHLSLHIFIFLVILVRESLHFRCFTGNYSILEIDHAADD